MCRFTSELFILFHWPTHLFLFHCQTVLIIIVLHYILKLGLMIFPALFFLKSDLDPQGILQFHMNFKIICSSSMKNVMGYINQYITLNNMNILTILISSSPIHEHGIALHLFVYFQFISSIFHSFQSISLWSPCLNLFLGILFFLIWSCLWLFWFLFFWYFIISV